MDSGNNGWANGVWFKYDTTLAIGDHNFRFLTNDGLGFPDIYKPANKTQYLTGPEVVNENSNPVLSMGMVTPKIGNPDTIFKYSIKYYDADLDSPKIAKVYIDDIPHPMTQTSSETGDESDGDSGEQFYEFSTNLPLGDHKFYFKFKDDNGSAIIRYPAIGSIPEVFEGPTIKSFSNSPATLGNGTVAPTVGHKLTLFSFTISYYDPEGDIPTNMFVVIDGQPYNLTRARIAQNIYFYETYLPLGEHYFHFEFWDAVNQHFLRYPAEASTDFLGPIVIDVPPMLGEGKVAPEIGTPNTVFNFSIPYIDVDKDMPLNAWIVIDDLKNNAIIKDLGEYGILLSYFTKLPLGEHTYYFEIHSGSYILRYPSSEYLIGPDVMKETDFNNHNNSNISIDTPVDDGNNSNLHTNNTDHSSSTGTPNKDTGEIQPDDPEINISVLDYTIREATGPAGIEYIFIITCQIPSQYIDKIICRLVINGNPYLMNKKKDSVNITRFVLNIKLSPGIHGYHLDFRIGENTFRYPYRGELRGPVLEDPAENDARGSERNTQSPLIRNLQIMAIIILLVSFIIYSIYFSYFQPKKRHGNR
jgi:hypothetical protein